MEGYEPAKDVLEWFEHGVDIKKFMNLLRDLMWEMVKMEIRSFTIKLFKVKAKHKRDEEKLLSSTLAQVSTKLQTVYSEDDNAELKQIKINLSEFVTERMLCAKEYSRIGIYKNIRRCHRMPGAETRLTSLPSTIRSDAS